MFHNYSRYNFTPEVYHSDVSNIWNVYEYISKRMYPDLPPGLDGKDYNVTEGLESFLYVTGSPGIEPLINITHKLPLDELSQKLINSFIVITCLLGLLGNGSVIWLLGFCLKRNPFTTYILNLSIADFGVLISVIITATFVIVLTTYETSYVLSFTFLSFLELFFFTYSAGQFLLAAISIDRCVAILFPLWHRCHRPPRLSSAVCALVWILSFLLSGIHLTLQMTRSFANAPLLFQFIVNAVLCTPLMVISTLTLFIQVCCKSKQRHRGKLVTAILLALLFFLLFAFPMNVFYVIHSFYVPNPILMVTGFACASLNSSINPLIYFLVGSRQRKRKLKVSMKLALQRIFRDDEDSMEEKTESTDTPL